MHVWSFIGAILRKFAAHIGLTIEASSGLVYVHTLFPFFKLSDTSCHLDCKLVDYKSGAYEGVRVKECMAKWRLGKGLELYCTVLYMGVRCCTGPEGIALSRGEVQ